MKYRQFRLNVTSAMHKIIFQVSLLADINKVLNNCIIVSISLKLAMPRLKTEIPSLKDVDLTSFVDVVLTSAK